MIKNQPPLPYLLNRTKLVKQGCFFLAFFAFVIVGQSQSPFLDTLQKDLEHYQKQVLQEKVYVHTDKTFYLPGETIWFKSYVLHAGTHQPMDLSKVLYVELLDNELKPVLQAKTGLAQGTGDGSFFLPASLHTGTYLLRAYTAWMKNFEESFYFHLPLQVVNTTRRPDWNSFNKKKGYTIQFFPEGGNLVDGIKTRLAFQLADENGNGVDARGYIIENQQDTVARFRPRRFGIGNFAFTPRNGVTYEAAIYLPDGDTLRSTLPPTEKRGYVLQVFENADGRLQVVAAADSTNAGRTVYLLAHTRGVVTFSSAKKLMTTTTEWSVAKDSLGDGISSFTLFDENRTPVCERLFFKRPTDNINIGLHTDAAVYNPRSEIQLDLSTTNRQGQAVKGELSLSVFLLDSLQDLPPNNIENYLWLTAELKGTIEQPGYYFSATDKNADEALDNLMLTHGWRRFRWQTVRARPTQPFALLPEYEGHLIRGRVVSKTSGNPVPNLLCFLSVPGERFQVSNAVSNANGELTFVLKNIYGPVELVAQADQADSTVQIELEKPVPAPVQSFKLPPFSLAEKWKDQLYNRHSNVQVSNAFSPAAESRFQLPQQQDSGVFYGTPDGSYVLDEFTRFPTMEEVMREVVAGVQVRRENDSFRFSVFNLPYRQYFTNKPLLLFDGVPVFSTSKIIAFDPLKVKRIDVVSRKYYWGHTTNSGIVSYRTYADNLAGFEPDAGVVLMEYNGLQLKREFYAPSYKETGQKQSREPDRRNVLLWQPTVITGNNGKKSIRFYTSDLRGRFAIVVEGIDKMGRIGSKWLRIDVK